MSDLRPTQTASSRKVPRPTKSIASIDYTHHAAVQAGIFLLPLTGVRGSSLARLQEAKIRTAYHKVQFFSSFYARSGESGFHYFPLISFVLAEVERARAGDRAAPADDQARLPR